MNFDEQMNFFDGLPDHVLQLVFNKVHDAKSLSLAMCSCKRFRAIVSQVDDVSLSIRTSSVVTNSQEEKKNLFKGFVNRVLVKPLSFLFRFLRSSKCNSIDVDEDCSYSMPNEALKPFNEVKRLEIKLPKSNFEKSSNLLKWKAEFGRQIKSCVLVGATSISKTQMESCCNNQEIRLSEEGFKLRIVWSISCLIAASARHILIQRTLNDHEKLESLVIRDESNQGLVSMNREQIQELKKSMISENGGEGFLFDRSKVPALRMKMWFVPELMLPQSAMVMKGATLVVMKPVASGEEKAEGCGSLVAAAFDGEEEEEENEVFGEAARELMKKEKSCILEITSF